MHNVLIMYCFICNPPLHVQVLQCFTTFTSVDMYGDEFIVSDQKQIMHRYLRHVAHARARSCAQAEPGTGTWPFS